MKAKDENENIRVNEARAKETTRKALLRLAQAESKLQEAEGST